MEMLEQGCDMISLPGIKKVWLPDSAHTEAEFAVATSSHWNSSTDVRHSTELS